MLTYLTTWRLHRVATTCATRLCAIPTMTPTVETDDLHDSKQPQTSSSNSWRSSHSHKDCHILTKIATVSRMLQASIVLCPASNWVTTVIEEATIALGVARHKAAKTWAKLNDKVYWDGSVQSFQSSRSAIEGHLLPVGAGYLLDAHFRYYYYKIDPSSCLIEQTFYHDSEIWQCTMPLVWLCVKYECCKNCELYFSKLKMKMEELEEATSRPPALLNF
jgi:hypothetical protein